MVKCFAMKCGINLAKSWKSVPKDSQWKKLSSWKRKPKDKDHGIAQEKRKDSKPRTVKISDEKKAIFHDILTNLQSIYGEKVEILKENKLISLEINGRKFKIDLIEQRKPKK